MKKSEETLQQQIKNLEEQLVIKNKLVSLFEESIPIEGNARKRYVADIALFYQTVFKEKIKHFIGLQMEELAQIGRTESANDIIRANINCFRLIDTWMETKTNEHLGNLEEMRSAFGEGDEFRQKLKETYNL